MSALPEEMWFGTINGQWPIQCWESDAHAMAWITSAKAGEHRQLWKAKIVRPVEFERVAPTPYLQPCVVEPS